MENNQMNQFFNEPQNAPSEPQQPFAKPPQESQSPFGQPTPQQLQSPFGHPTLQQQAQSPFGQNRPYPVFGQEPINLIVEVEPTPEMKKKITMASNVAVVGGSVVVIGTIICIIINFLLLADVNKVGQLIGFTSDVGEAQTNFYVEIVGEFIILIISLSLTVLAYFLRKLKRNTTAIILIVFSVLFGLLFSYAIVNGISGITTSNTIISNHVGKVLSAKDRAVLDIFKNMANLSKIMVVVNVISTIGWVFVLLGGILRTVIKDNQSFVKFK